MTRRNPLRRLRNQRGALTLIEVMVAAVILLVILWGASQYFSRGRNQVDHEESRRKATAAAQLRLDQLRAYRYQDLPAYDSTDTTITVSGRSFKVALAVTPASPNPHATTLTANVTWRMNVDPDPVKDTRTAQVTTIVGRVVR